MVDAGASPATVSKAHLLLFAVLQDAVTAKKVAANEAANVRLPKAEKRAHAHLSHSQVAELVQAVTGGGFRLLVGILAYCGIRFGEAAALRVGDINVARRRLTVSRSVAEVGGRLLEGAPKNWQIRWVPIPMFLVAPLAKHIEGKHADDLVFTSSRGGQLRLNTWRRRVFATALGRVAARRKEDGVREEFPAVTPHDLRHTAASLAVASGASVKVVQRMLGHSSAAMTLDTYADLFDVDLNDVAEALNLRATESGIADFLRPERPETNGSQTGPNAVAP